MLQTKQRKPDNNAKQTQHRKHNIMRKHAKQQTMRQTTNNNIQNKLQKYDLKKITANITKQS